jgi:hypothetical protein
MNVGQFGIFHTQADGTVALTDSAQKNLDAALNSSPTSKLCSDLSLAGGIGEVFWANRNLHQLYETADGLVVTAFNSFNPPKPSDSNEQRIGSFGTSANVFYGIPAAYFSWNMGFSIPTLPPLPRLPRPLPPLRPRR